MSSYSFNLKPITIKKRTRFYGWLLAFHDRRALLTQFKNDLHIEKLENENIGYKLPESYLVTTNEISRLYDVRDKIINIYHKEYVEKQKEIDDRVKEIEKEHEDLKINRLDERKELNSLRGKLRTIRSSDDHIAMEARIAKAEAKLDNTDAAIKNCESQVGELLQEKKMNLANWKKQVKDIEKSVEMVIKNYIKRATSKIEIKYGFTNFIHAVAKYDEGITKIVEGEY